MIPASAPRRVVDRLRRAPDGPRAVLHRGTHALYLDLDGQCVGVVAASAAQVPCALRTRLSVLASQPDVRVVGGEVHLDGVPVRVGRVCDAAVPRVEHACSGELAADVERLVGAGDGLTPYGDDVLCGWLAACRAASVATPAVDAKVRALMPRTTLLSATLLDCAMHGEALPELAAFLTAVGTDEEPIRAAELARVGHTSGAGLLEGARQAWAA